MNIIKESRINFLELIGRSQSDYPEEFVRLIAGIDLAYSSIEKSENDQIMLRILARLFSGELKKVGEWRKDIWNSGWKENLDQINSSAALDINDLTPKFIRPEKYIRFKNEFRRIKSDSFERDFNELMRKHLFYSFMSCVENIYEFGCGSGYNLFAYSRIRPDLNLYGLDWAKSSVDILNRMKERENIKIEGHIFDFYKPNYDLKIKKNSAVLTMCALEQIGEDHKDFVEYLLINAPSICVHMEPLYDLYDERSVLDFLAMEFHRQRGYLSKFVELLKKLEVAGRVEIIELKRIQFGSIFHEGYSYVVWRPC
jgi:SAM-dependent methyltransferase